MPYDLKVMPAVDQSKEKDAIPPPGAEKKDAEKKDGDKKEADKHADHRRRSRSRCRLMWAGTRSPPTASGWRCGRNDPQTPGEKKETEAKADADWVNHDMHGTRLYLVRDEGGRDAGRRVEGRGRGARCAQCGVVAELRQAAGGDGADERPERSGSGGRRRLWWMRRTPDKPQKLDAIPPTVGNIAFAPDESAIVFSAATKEDAPPGYDELYALPKESSGAKVIPLVFGIRGAVGIWAAVFLAGWHGDCAGGNGNARDAGAADAGREQAAGAGGPGRAGDERAEYESQENRMGVDGGERRRSRQKLCYAEHLGDACTALPMPELAPKGPEGRGARAGEVDERRVHGGGIAVSAAAGEGPAKRSRWLWMCTAGHSVLSRIATIRSQDSCWGMDGRSSGRIRAARRITA